MIYGLQLPSIEVLLQLLGIGLSNGAVIALNAIGVTLVYGAVRMINFAHGDLFALTTAAITSIILNLGLQREFPAGTLVGGLALALVAAMGFGVVLNVAIERVAFRPFRAGSRLAPLIAGIGLSFMLYQLALLWRKTEPSFFPGRHESVPGVPEVPRMRVPELLPDINLAQAVGLKLIYSLKDLLVLLLAAGLALLVGWFLRRTRAGRALRACAQDPEMAELCGVDRNGSIRLAFAIGGALAGAAAFVFTLYYNRPFGHHGAQSGLIAFAAAVLGGIGRPGGAFLSGLLLGVLAAFSDFFLAPEWTPVLVLSILIVLLMLRPTGLADREHSEELSDVPALEGIAGANRHSGPWPRRLTWGLFALALVYPLIDRLLGWHQEVVMTGVLIFALLALGLNILLGFAGLLDLGYAAIFGIGGYTAGMLTDPSGRLAAFVPGPTDFLVVLALSIVTAGLFGVINGALTLRLRGDYLAIVTLAFGQIVPRIFLNLDEWTGGASGMAALPPPRIFGHALAGATERYYLVLALVLLGAFVSLRLARSRLGRAWAALSEDETAAISSGISVSRLRPLAFGIGAIMAGVAGALYAGIFSYVEPDQSEFRLSAMALAMVVIGGAGSVRGAIVGALVIGGYNYVIIPLLGAWLYQLGQTNGGWLLAASTLRELTYLTFGLALYFTVRLRARQSSTS